MQSSIAAVYIVVADINFLINASSSVDYVLYGLTFVSLLIMRVTHCKTARPYKVEVHGVYISLVGNTLSEEYFQSHTQHFHAVIVNILDYI